MISNNIINCIAQLGVHPNGEKNSQYEFNGHIVPRVTEIISKCIHEDSIVQWANNLGFKHKSYTKTLQGYADIGSEAHNQIDKYIDFVNSQKKYFLPYEGGLALEMLDDIYWKMSSKYKENIFCAFHSYVNWLYDLHDTHNNVEFIMHEQKVSCEWFGGTIDGLYKINGLYYLIDYKTSNQITYKYFLQLAAYRYLLKLNYSIEVSGFIVLQLSKSEWEFSEYFINFQIPEHLKFANDCEVAFLSLVFAYYNIYNAESEYKELMKNGGIKSTDNNQIYKCKKWVTVCETIPDNKQEKMEN